MAADMAVVATAYQTAKSMGASDKVMLALFEAGVVESGFRNLDHGDRDSVGYLQQRPSQGWSNPRDVPTATRSFVSKAMPIEGKYATAGLLAQAVQRSAFPLKYDAARAEASALLIKAGGSNNTSNVSLMGLPGSDQLDSLTKLLKGIGDKNLWIRVGLFAGGSLLLYVGLYTVINSGGLVGNLKSTAVSAATGGKL